MIADPEGPSFISRTVTRSCMDQLNARDTRPTAEPEPRRTMYKTLRCNAAAA